MKRLTIMLIAALAALMLTGCPGTGQDPAQDPVTYAIGDTGPSGVGIVFYVTDGGLHGLEAAPSDQSTSTWIAGGSTTATLNGNTSTEIGTGSANTDAIIAQTDHTGSAAQVCRDYDGGGETDWFLPSQDELYQLYLQKDTVGGFVIGPKYWSSSEHSSSSAHSQYFSTGQDTDFKYTSLRVRAIRAF